jgi:crotonobetainyl-CoA:carnitine CoA-transferase CaiB-like acyl-CoA transferase
VAEARPPLDGIRIVDLTSYIAGSYAAMMLADLGAHVDKIESPAGDSFRELPGFYGWNRGKRSVCVDLKTPEGREIVERLVRAGDVVMENMRPGVSDRLGLGEEALRKINPRVIYCAVTAFGSTGPYADRPGFDPLLQAMAGHMAIQGATGPPQFIRIAINDYYAAALAAQGVLAALFTRERTGVGQRVETSLLHASLALQSGSMVDYPGKPTFARENPTYRLYEAGDGEWFFLACGNQAFWGKLTKVLGLDHLRDDPRFAGWLPRLEHSAELLPILVEAFKAKPRDHWVELLTAHDIPAGRVQPLAEFMNDPAVRHHEMVQEYEGLRDTERLTLMGRPVKLSPAATRDPGPPPGLDEHTDQVLRELGYDATAIADLRARRIVGATPGAGPLPRIKST